MAKKKIFSYEEQGLPYTMSQDHYDTDQIKQSTSPLFGLLTTNVKRLHSTPVRQRTSSILKLINNK